MGMSSWSSTDNYKCVSLILPPVSLSSIMAVLSSSSSSNLLLLLLMSSLDWLSTPGSAFFMGRHRVMSPGKFRGVFLLYCYPSGEISSKNRAMCSKKINKSSFSLLGDLPNAAHQTLTDVIQVERATRC